MHGTKERNGVYTVMNEEIEAILHGYVDETLSDAQWEAIAQRLAKGRS